MRTNAPHIITLTTDFGYKDPFIAEMKGVILSIDPSATIIDITHDIEPFNIVEASFVIGSSFSYFPPGTIHVTVVDPGVGSERRPIIVEAGGRFYVGPDNGVFTDIVQRERQFRCFHVLSEAFMLSKKSPTFQGRDIFAPAAARLSTGIPPTEAGPVISDPVLINIPKPKLAEGCLTGEIIYIDRFGNAITNITADDLQGFERKYEVEIRAQRIAPVNHYAQSSAGSLGCLLNSSGRLEIFSYLNNAAKLFGIEKADPVSVLLGGMLTNCSASQS